MKRARQTQGGDSAWTSFRGTERDLARAAVAAFVMERGCPGTSPADSLARVHRPLGERKL
jgi:hypothetical protein